MNLLKDITYNSRNSSITIDSFLVEETNEILTEINKANTKKILNEHVEKAKNKINIIFEQIIDKSSNENFIFFVKELKILIFNYLNHYNSLKKFNFIENDLELKLNQYYFGNIDENSLKQINNISKRHIEDFKKKSTSGLTSREDLTLNTGPDIRKIIKILNNFFEKNGDLKKISSYMRQKYHVGMCALELSIPSSSWWKNNDSSVSEKTWYAHLDQEQIYPKSIMYLSDVNKDNGPTSFYPKVYSEYMKVSPLQDLVGRVITNIGNNLNSKFFDHFKYKKFKIESDNFKEYFNMLPGDIKFENHFGWFVKKNTRLENLLVKNEKSMVGLSGSYVVFDGSKILHRGGLIKQGFRVALQIVFTPKENKIINILKKIFRKIN